MISFQTTEHAQTLAQAIMNTLPEPFLVLDDQFRVLAASAAFYRTFEVDPEQTIGCLLYALGDGQWDIPSLRVLLETIIPERTAMDGFEVEHDFPRIGRKTMFLNARQVVYEDHSKSTILLAIRDATVSRTIEREKDELQRQTQELLRQKDVLLQEMEHRVANSLQIIASILLIKARAVSSEETRKHLKDAHQRVMSVAEVQRHLHTSAGLDTVDVRSYLTKLCSSLGSSMIGESQPIEIKVRADSGAIGSDKAVSIGLIVTELVINAIKYAFPESKADAHIYVTYETNELDWKLTVSDNGVGQTASDVKGTGTGLGTAIVQALVSQLEAVRESVIDENGMEISVTRATFTSGLPNVA
ncbi:sensor histidine kinase [Rhizobium sp. LjRoot254]|uniref:sensor histidine kinase n=1 Tax=Rhizobium sp. LjRoot254 TaxID=3342297 RepID=UPI003ECE2A64